MTKTVYDSRGQRIILGKELGRAGEGTVLEVCDGRKLAAKVYHSPISEEKSAKLKGMVSQYTERLLKISAWPVDTLYDAPGGKVTGFLMPQAVQPYKIHDLYGVKSRLAKFPQANWHFLLYTAMNLAKAFHAVHELGFIIGDINEGNVFVTTQATVMLLDCDSFQVRAHGRLFLCEVGVENYTPPELHGTVFKNVERTVDHDAFGLAVLIFLLLCLGRHPYAGGYLGTGDMPIGRAIPEDRFAYGKNAQAKLMRPPPATLPLTALSQPVATLFERAFMRPTAGQNRPRPQEWVSALDTLIKSIKVCDKHTGHIYWNGLPACPWCLIETAAGILVFPFIAPQATQTKSTFDINVLWKQIASIVPPGPPIPFPTQPQASMPPSQWALKQKEGYSKGYMSFVSLMGMDGKRAAARQHVRQAMMQAQLMLRNLQQQWDQQPGAQPYYSLLTELEAKRMQYTSLAAWRQQRLQQLDANRRQSQLQKFLDGFIIWHADISGVGPGRKSTLQSYGIETAADVSYTAVMNVPGFGPTFTTKMLTWRNLLEKRFVFNSALGVDKAELYKVEADVAATRQQLEQELKHGAGKLLQIQQYIMSQRQILLQQVDKCFSDIAQAQSDLSIL